MILERSSEDKNKYLVNYITVSAGQHGVIMTKSCPVSFLLFLDEVIKKLDEG